MIDRTDHQQLLLMKESIDEFEKTPLTLESLLSITKTLEDLLNDLKNIRSEWREAFRTEWWELELISAVMMDEEADEISQTGQEKIVQVIHRLKEMLEEEYTTQTKFLK